MIDRMAQNAARWFAPYLRNEEQKAYLQYGMNAAIYTLTSTFGLLLIGAALRAFASAVIMIAVFYLNQTIGGGFHARSHIACFSVMSAAMIGAVLLCRIDLPAFVLFFLSLCSLVGLFFMPVVLHSKRAYLSHKLPLYTKRTRLCIVFEAVITLICFCINRMCAEITWGLVVSCVSRLTACVMNRD